MIRWLCILILLLPSVVLAQPVTPAGAPVNAPYITKTAVPGLTNEQALGALSTGVLKVTNGTGTLSTAVAGTDYIAADAELAALAGLTSAADKLPYFTGTGTAAVTTVTSTARDLLDDANASAMQSTLGLSSVYQGLDADLTALAGLTSAADKLPYFTGSGTATVTTVTSAARDLLDDADASVMRTTLGLSSVYQGLDAELTAVAGVTSAADKMPYFTGSGTATVTTVTSAARDLLDDADASAMRTTLGLGSVYQGLDAELTALAGLTSAADQLPYFTGSGTAAVTTVTSAARDLLNDAATSDMRTTLGLGTLATDNHASLGAVTMAGNIALGANYLSGDGQNEGVRVSSSGNVGIGTGAPATTLHTMLISGSEVSAPTLGSASGGSFLVGNSSALYGLLMGVGVNGQSWIQSQRVDASATAYPLKLQPSGNGVHIGNIDSAGAAMNTLAVKGDIASYNAFTNTSNYERLRIVPASGNFNIAAERAGTGTANIGITLTPVGTGNITVDQNTNATGLYIDSEATSASPLDIEADTITTGKVINIDNANALTTGSLAYFYSNSVDTGTRNLVSIHNDSGLATGATALQVRQDCATPPGIQAIGPNGSTGVAANANGNNLVMDNAHNAGLSILSANANLGTIFFGDTDDVAKAYVQYNHSTDDMNLVSGASVLLSGNAGGQYRYALLTGDGYPTIYNAHSHSTTNYDRARTYWNSNVFTIATQSAGSMVNSNRNIAITPEGGTTAFSGNVTMTANAAGWQNTLSITQPYSSPAILITKGGASEAISVAINGDQSSAFVGTGTDTGTTLLNGHRVGVMMTLTAAGDTYSVSGGRFFATQTRNTAGTNGGKPIGIYANATTTANAPEGAAVFAESGSARSVPIVAKANSGQTSNLFELQSSAGALLGSYNADGTILRLGPTANTHPSLKRSSTELQVRLADDSAPTALTSTKAVTVDTDGGTYTASDCADELYANTGDADGQTVDLPDAAAGLTVTFYCTVAQNFDVNPQAGDQILSLTNAAGDAIRGAAIGASVTLTAIDSTNWAVTSVIGTWTDIN